MLRYAGSAMGALLAAVGLGAVATAPAAAKNDGSCEIDADCWAIGGDLCCKGEEEPYGICVNCGGGGRVVVQTGDGPCMCCLFMPEAGHERCTRAKLVTV